MRMRECIGKLSARVLAQGLRCPYDWYPALAGREPPCVRGADCEECIRRMLEEPAPAGVSETEAAMESFSPIARERIQEAMEGAP